MQDLEETIFMRPSERHYEISLILKITGFTFLYASCKGVSLCINMWTQLYISSEKKQ